MATDEEPEYKSALEILQGFGEEKVEALGRDLPEGSDATGKLRGSIRFYIKILGTVYRFALSLEDYYIYVNDDRKPGSFPPIDKIQQWIADKRISIIKRSGKLGLKTRGKSDRYPTDKERKGLAFLFARKIYREGKKGNHFFDKNINDKAKEKLRADLLEAMKQDASIYIKLSVNGGNII